MSKSDFGKWWLLASFALVGMIPSVVACAADKGTVVISEVDWTGGLVDMTLAKIILEEEMGYKVKTVYLDTQALWVGAAGGDIDLIVERWPSAEFSAMKEYLTEHGGSGQVLNMGPMGIIGESGYYVPRYVIEGDSERGIEPLHRI